MKVKSSKSKIMSHPKKIAKKIVEFYYLTPSDVKVKELSAVIKSVAQDQVEIWPDLNLMEVVLESDSLIFQDARECFIDPLDQEYFEAEGIVSMYTVSYEIQDEKTAKSVLREILQNFGGFIGSDTDDFEPKFTEDTL